MTPEMMATLTTRLHELVQAYSSNYDQFQRATYNETQVRVDFVNRFFALLGWDVDNERGLPQHLREVTHEATVVVEENGIHRSKKPDYGNILATENLIAHASWTISGIRIPGDTEHNQNCLRSNCLYRVGVSHA